MKRYVIFMALVLILAGTAFAQERPRAIVDTTMPMQTGVTVIATASGNLQAALDLALPGDTVELTAGVTFTGRYAFNNKVDNGKWIVVRSALSRELPDGMRVSPSDSPKCAKLVPPDNLQALDFYPTSNGYTKARKWRFIGIEVEPNPSYANSNLIKLGTNGSWQSSADQAPEDIIFDRCYIHGLPGKDAYRAVSICSMRSAFIHCYISEFHVLGGESQGILIANSPGVLLFEDDYIEGATENLMSGGLDVRIPGLVPSDITVRRCTFVKPMTWQGKGYKIKNLFELKNAQRVLVEENDFHNCWVDGQVGFAVQLTARNQDGANPWATIRDVTFVGNKFDHVTGGFNVTGHDDLHSSQQTQRITIRGNTFLDFNAPGLGDNGRVFQFIYDIVDLVVSNNSVDGVGSTPVVLTGAPYQMTRFVFTDNIFSRGLYGVKADGGGEGTAALEQYAPGYIFLRNVLIGGGSAQSLYPAGNYFTY